MALGFEVVAINRVGEFLRRIVLKVDGLTRIGTHAGGNEHQPGQQPRPILGRIFWQKFLRFLGEI